MKWYIYILIIVAVWCGLPAAAFSQSGYEAFYFLRMPSSAKANAIGGHTVSLIEQDPALAFHNPSLFGSETDGMISISYLNYISDINIGNAIYTKACGERAAWGAGISFIGYGSMLETSADNTVLGEFSAKDVAIDGFFAYDLSPYWRGGASLKFLFSSLAEYSSFGIAVDAGISYFNPDNEFSFGATFKNIGAQIKAYDEERQKMPWDIQMGFSKRMEHAPFRFSVTAMYLNRWKFDYIEKTEEDDGTNKYDNFFPTLLKHLVFGIEFIPSDNFWIGAGFNPKTHYDMKLNGANGFGGFSAGAGVSIKMFDISASIAKYHPSALSFMLGITASLSEF